MALASSSTFSEGVVWPPSESEELPLPDYVTIIILLNVEWYNRPQKASKNIYMQGYMM